MRRLAALIVLAALAAAAVLVAGRDEDRRGPVGGSASSSSPPGDGAVVWAVGDAAGPAPAHDAVARLVTAAPDLDRLLYLGDVYERGRPAEFRRHYAPRFGALAERTAPTPGNHEWPERERGYLRYWAGVRGHAQPTRYAFRLGGWELIGLNSEEPHGPGSAQVRWLRDRLRGATGDCRLAFWHRPRHNAGTGHGDAPDVAPLWDALRGRARLVLNGHEHSLQRLRPIDGITTLIAGAGGRGHHPLAARDPRLAFGDDARDGALRLVLEPGRAAFAFVATDGRVLDEGAVRCRA